MAELRGKGWRVLGYFFWMLGAGILLEGSAKRFGGTLLGAGAAMFLAGMWQGMTARPSGGD